MRLLNIHINFRTLPIACLNFVLLCLQKYYLKHIWKDCPIAGRGNKDSKNTIVFFIYFKHIENFVLH